jgi:AcrR family transcriptional regulator
MRHGRQGQSRLRTATRPRRNTPRTYLRSDARREQLLATAADLVGKRGWSALGMLPLAEAAGVSRQLVYEHFTDTSDLCVSVMRHLFEHARAATNQIVATVTDDTGGLIRRAYDVYLGLPPVQRRALRALAGDSGPDVPQVRRARHMMRHEILGLWVPYVRRRTGFGDARARALVWMLTAAAWGLTDLVEDGTLSRDEAKDLLAKVVEGAVESTKQIRARRRLTST